MHQCKTKSNGFKCKSLECLCIKNAFLCGQDGSIDLSELLEEVKGPATFKCLKNGYDGGRYNCEFDEPVFRENLGPLLGSRNPVFELKCDASKTNGFLIQ